jgi:hypothetical protein
MRRVGLVILGLSLGIAPSVAQERFDLNCSLQETTSLSPNKPESYSRHLAIDLSSGKWCYWDSGCNEIRRVALIGPDEIRTVDIHNDKMTIVTTIDRHTLNWTGHAETNFFLHATAITIGTCERASFTPFPVSEK